MAEHTYGEGKVAIPSTCTQAGTMEYSCTACAHIREEALPLAEHTPGEPFSTVEANCVSEGQKTATCTQCAVEFVTEILPKNNAHNLKTTVTRAATCTATGAGIASCTRCDYSENVTYEKKPHSLGKAYLHIIATCIDRQVLKRDCVNCGHVEYVYGERGNHWYFGGICVNCGKVK